MGPPAGLRDEDLEDQLREMMRRRATDVEPRRPGWDTLATVRRGPAATPFRSGPGWAAHGRAFPGWVRPVVAAASVLAIVLVGAVVLDRSGTESSDDPQDAQAAGRSSPSPAPEVPDIPAPGSEQFDLRHASPAYPVQDEALLADLPAGELDALTDPEQVASDYLAQVGLVAGRGPISEVKVGVMTDPDLPASEDSHWTETGEVVMAWSTWDDGAPALASGQVYLRRADLLALDGKTPDAVWIVVGARARGVLFDKVRREGTTLSFVVDRDRDESGMDSIQVEINGRMIQDGTVAVDEPREFIVPVPEDEVAVVRVQHLDGQDPISVTAMAVPATTSR